MREHAVDSLVASDLGKSFGEAWIVPRRHLVEVITEEVAGGLVSHVGTDQRDLLLAVLAQSAQQGRRSGSPRGGHQDLHITHLYTSNTSASSRPLSMPWVRAMFRMYSSLA